MSEEKDSTKCITNQKLSSPEGWNRWSKIIELHYRATDQWDLIKPYDAAEQEQKMKSDNEYQKRAFKMMSDILKCLDDKHACLVLEAGGPMDMWRTLERHIQGDKMFRIASLDNEMSEKATEDTSMEAHLSRFKKLKGQYKNLGGELSDHELALKLLSTLPSTSIFLQMKSSLRRATTHRNDGKYDITEVENEIQATARESNVWQKALKKEQILKTQVRIKGKCHHCGKIGHREVDCRIKRKDDQEKSNETPDKKQQVVAGWVTKAYKTTTTCCSLPETCFCGDEHCVPMALDSGATMHMTADADALCNITTCEDVVVETSSGERFKASKLGTLKATIPNATIPKFKVEMKDTILTPNCPMGILSISALENKGYSVLFKQGMATIFTPDDQVLYKAEQINGLYLVHLQPKYTTLPYSKSYNTISRVSDDVLWHWRLGHPGKSTLATMNRHNTVQGLNTKGNDFFCHGCCEGKMTNNPISKHSIKKPDVPLQRIGIDAWGPSPTRTDKHYTGFFMITDMATSYRWIYLTRSTNEIPVLLINWAKMIQRQTEYVLKVIRADNGTEFVNKKLRNWASEEGIKWEFSAPYTPQQNGVAERGNGIIVPGARAMLRGAKLSKNKWGYAVLTKCYLINRTSTRSNLNHASPFEAFFGIKPRVNHLRVFGALGYSTSARTKKKLDSRGERVRMLGYSDDHQAYVVQFMKTQRVGVSRTVIFDEQKTILDSNWGDDDPTDPTKSPSSTSIAQASTNQSIFSDVGDEKAYDHENEPIEHDNVDKNEHANDIDVDSTEATPENTKSDTLEDASDTLNNDGIGASDPESRRSNRSRRLPSHLQDYALLTMNNKICKSIAPKTYRQAIQQADAQAWQDAYDKELNSLETVGDLKVITRPENVEIIPVMELFDIKTDNVTGEVKNKVRIVARGDQQSTRPLPMDTFAPVVRSEVVRILFAVAAQLGLNVRQVDVSTAFLYGRRNKPIYLELSAGHPQKDGKSKIWKGFTAIYGLDDASKIWNEALDEFLVKYGFVKCPVEMCLYIMKTKDVMIMLGIYVDDGAYIGTDEKALDKFEKELQKTFNVKLKKEAKTFLGYQIQQEAGRIQIHQTKYVEKITAVFELDEAKDVKTPMDEKLILKEMGEEMQDIRLYQALIGSLLYSAICTRPDVSFAVNQLSQFNSNPSKGHLKYAKRVLKYLNETKGFGLSYKKNNELKLTGVVDSDYANDEKDRKSISGYIICINGTPVIWSTKKQKSVALSSTESEYYGYTMIAQELMWIRQVLDFMGFNQSNPTVVYADNQSAIKMALNPKSHGRTKHVDVRMHYIREQVKNGNIRLEYISTEEMTADMLTKNLGRRKFEYFRNKIMEDFNDQGECCNSDTE